MSPGDFERMFAGLGSGPAGSVYKEWESWFGQNVQRLAQSDLFATALGRMLSDEGILRAAVEKTVAGAVAGFRRGDLEALEARVAELEKELAALKAKATS